ncbi:MFS general substrate transporter [Atractiella rhizophila]|nr:MFS general substrate transporter [Atractiella rhizophila]
MAGDERTPLLQENRREDEDIKDVPPAAQDPDNNPKAWVILSAVWCGVFLGALDTTIVATLVSSISSSFNSSHQSSWLGTSYLLTVATFTPIYGRLCDIAGRRFAVLTALSWFTIGTAACGFAPSMTFLIVARLAAGLGGGGIMTTSSIIASDLFPLRKRGFIQGVTNILFGAGAGLGGPLGGFIADTIGWRWAFIIQLPVLLAAFILVSTFVKYKIPGQGKSKKEMIKRIDYLGSLTLIVSIGSLLISLSFKNNELLPWSDPKVWSFLIVFGVAISLFIYVETCVSAEPVMPLTILNTRNGICIALTNFITSMGAFSVLYFWPYFFETVLLTNSATAGLHLLVNSPCLSIGSLFAGWYMRHTGRYYRLTVIAAILSPIGLAIMSTMNRDSPGWLTWIAICPSGLGFSTIITSTLIALIASVDRSQIAVATGITYLFRYTGQVVGVALSSSLMQSVLTAQLRQRIHGPGAEDLIEEIRHRSSIVRELEPDIQLDAILSYRAGLRAVFIFNAALTFICFLCTLPIKEYPLPGTFKEERESREARECATTEDEN